MIDLKQCSLGIELGSTRIKAVLVGDTCKPVAQGDFTWENRLENGIWTYPLEEVWQGVQAAYAALAADVLAKCGQPLTTVGCIGVSAMMHGYLAFDAAGKLLVPFRTWRNTMTGAAAEELTSAFGFNIPQRWSAAHLYQAMLNREPHLPQLDFFTTLAGYVHWQLTGRKVLGEGDASGMFPIDSTTGGYDTAMLAKFNALADKQGCPVDLVKLLPTVLPAGEDAGMLTVEGAKRLDPTGTLQPGMPVVEASSGSFGAALAVSILEQLRRQGSLLMATTHYAELKVYALETPGVVNASCEFNVETLMPTYKLSVGVPGKSNAFLISAKLGIPQEIIDAARNHMSNDDKRLDSVLSQLDDLKVQLKDAQAEAEQARYEAEHALESAEKKRDDLIKKGEEELENARRQAHDLMQQVQNEAYSLTDELRRIQKDEKTSAAQRAVRAREIARRDTETLLKKTDAKPQPVKEFVPLKEVQIGQEVVIADLGQTATVTARPDRNGMVEVRAGIMKTKVPLTNLRAPDKMEKRKPAEPRRSTRVQLDKSRKTSMELNLLGYTVEEALAEVDRFLDHAMLSNQNTVYIIHGNGTGALRNAIQKHLRTHRGVKSFRLGRYGEGESGVTVVELK